jgi:L-lactate dehydrogenase complex protein LldG
VIPVENTGRVALLERVRSAFGHPERGSVTVLSEYRASRTVRPGVVDLFVERVEECEATVHRVSADEVEETLAQLVGSRRTVVPRGFPWTVPKPVQDTWLDASELDEIPAVATTVTLGIATTGTLVLTHGKGQGRKLLTLMPELHVCVVLEDQVVFGVPDAIAALDPHRPQTWVSGPAGADEPELDRVEDVRGPKHLEVVLVRAS